MILAVRVVRRVGIDLSSCSERKICLDFETCTGCSVQMEFAIGDATVEVAYEHSQSLGGISVLHAEMPPVLGRGFASG